VKTEEIKMEPIDLNVISTHYVSDEQKDREIFDRYYNNNNLYVTFRDQYVAKTPEDVKDDVQMVRDLFENVVAYRIDRFWNQRPYKKNEPMLSLRKVYEKHVVIAANVKLSRMGRLAEELENAREILAVEWFDKKVVYGWLV
jgi:hypothetical protein